MAEETQDQAYPGQRGLMDSTSQYNAVEFVVRMLMGYQATATLVLVKEVTPSGIGPNIGVVAVQPMVNQIDSLGTPQPHGTIFNLPYFRLQGGANAIVMDPQVGDIGMAVFASRDISAVKATREVSNPGSYRRFDMADGVYVGGFLNGTPTQYVEFTGAGINIVSPTAVTVNVAGPATINGEDVVIHGSHSVSSDVNGLGSRTTHVGGSIFQVDNYTTGATVNSTNHPWVPPTLPDP